MPLEFVQVGGGIFRKEESFEFERRFPGGNADFPGLGPQDGHRTEGIAFRGAGKGTSRICML